MIVAGGRIFTIEQRRDEEFAVAYDFETGKEIWSNRWKAFFQESMGGDGPRATPAYDSGRVYFLGAEGELRCLNARTGAQWWRKNILEDNGAPNIQWGMAASPLVVEDMVVVLPGGGGGKSVVAYDKRTGEKRWTALDDPAAYTAPVTVTLNGVRQLVVLTAQRAVGLTLDGKLLWEYPWITDYGINSTLPIIAGANRVLLSAGYGHGSALLELALTGGTWSVREVWKSQSMKCKFNNAVLHKGVVYGLDEGILAAMDVQTGKRLWKGGRYGYGQVLLAGDHLVITSESGEVALVRAIPEGHQEIAKFEAVEGKTWNVPAIAGGRLLVRNTAEMASFEIGVSGPKER
jgi:outer membrane protein assembly factor BamB